MYSIYRKFSSFEELVNDFLARDGIAIRCGNMEGETSEVSYRDFGEMIISESFHVRAECSSVEVVRYEQTVDSLVDILMLSLPIRVFRKVLTHTLPRQRKPQDISVKRRGTSSGA